MAFALSFERTPCIQEIREESGVDSDPATLISLGEDFTIVLDRETSVFLLEMTSSDYEIVENEVLQIIEMAMRTEISADNLNAIKRQIASDYVSPALTVAQEQVVITLAPQFLAPNTFIDEEATSLLRSEVVSAFEPVTRSINEGQEILHAGEVVNEEDIEILEQLGLLSNEVSSADYYWLFTLALIALFWWLLETPKRP